MLSNPVKFNHISFFKITCSLFQSLDYNTKSQLFALVVVMVTAMDLGSIPLIWWKWKPSNIRQPRSSTKSTSLTIRMRYYT